MLPLFAGRVLPFDLACTQAYAVMMAKARGAALDVAAEDGYIAAIAAAKGFAVVTRDICPFEAAGHRHQPLGAGVSVLRGNRHVAVLGPPSEVKGGPWTVTDTAPE